MATIRQIPLLLGEQVKQIKKGRDISVYPEITERPITPEDDCCKKVCPVINDLIENTYKGVKICEVMIDFGMKGTCYNKMKHDTDALLRIRQRLAEQGICKCYE